jgi:hypothetical protein
METVVAVFKQTCNAIILEPNKFHKNINFAFCRVMYFQLTQQKIQQNAKLYQNLLFHIYMKLNMFRATHRPSSGA